MNRTILRPWRIISHLKNSSACPIPIFLCPALLQRARGREANGFQLGGSRSYNVSSRKSLGAETRDSFNESHDTVIDSTAQHSLPVTCPGCGALTQGSAKGQAGFYTSSRKTVRIWSRQEQKKLDARQKKEDGLYQKAVEGADEQVLQSLGLLEKEISQNDDNLRTPACDRCHDLLHHGQGVPIIHPSIDSLHDTIDESPYKYNHIYHVLDAADFPSSLIPQIHRQLEASPLRSQNRRSKSGRFHAGRKTELSFIITRSDLLAPRKEQVDTLMPYLLQVLRDALGSTGKDVRLGNVRCVSAKRGWWTKEVKEDIWRRGGGGWLVGRVNVGKSNLFESVFPKGRNDKISFEKLRQEARGRSAPGSSNLAGWEDSVESQLENPWEETLSANSLLPPVRPEEAYPPMPTISPLPGTTASPIRLAFGNGRGELIDLPGLPRPSLDQYVKEGEKHRLLMEMRTTPEQLTIKPGQSLLLGGLIRITPMNTNITMLAYPFLPSIGFHVTSTHKAVSYESEPPRIIDSIAREGLALSSAGKIPLKWDVTKQRSGPLTDPAAVGLKMERLSYRVFATDLLIEGTGWVELVAQVRKADLYNAENGQGEDKVEDQDYPAAESLKYPEVEVFSPAGECISSRRPLNAWLLGGPPKKAATVRPRRSMKGVKKTLKRIKRGDHSQQ